MALTTPPDGTLLGSATYPHRQKHGVLTEVTYAHPSGDNANDGLTWGTAKKDVVSAYDALPSTGGQVLIADSTYWDSVNTDRGLWLLGSDDPGYSGGSPTGGWRVRKRCAFIGVGGAMSTGNSHLGPQCFVLGGSSSDRAKPSIWIAGSGGPLYFENIHNQYPAVGWRFGIESDGAGFIDSAGITMRGCSIAVANGVEPGKGPAVELGFMYWLFMEHCTLNGNQSAYTLTAATRSGTTATFTTSVAHTLAVGDTVFIFGVTPSGYNGTWRVTSVTSTTFVCTLTADPGGSGTVFGYAEPVVNYRRAAIAHDSYTPSQTSSGLIHLDSCNFNAGGFYYRPSGTTSWGSIIMRNITHEGDFFGPEPPTLLIRTQAYGDPSVPPSGYGFYVQNIERADAFGAEAAVEIEGPQTDPGIVTVVNASAAGNVTQLPSITTRQQSGIDSGEFIGRHSGHKRAFSPSVVRTLNYVTHTLSGGTWTTGLRAPDGTTNASSLTASAEYILNAGGWTFAVGDWLIAGVWHRTISLGTSDDANFPLVSHNSSLKFDGGTTNYFILDGPHRWEDGAWSWHAEAHKVTTGGTGDMRFQLRAHTGNTVAYFAPMLCPILASEGLPDAEVYEIVRHLQAYPSDAPLGSVTTLAGQKLLARGGLGVGNSAAATTPGSVVKKMEVFSETGASLGFVPIYSTIT